MVGGKEHIELVSIDEALKLKEYMTVSEMFTVEKLHSAYRKEFGYDEEQCWDAMCLLSFIYDIGRIQGIREERRKRAN